MKKWLKDAIDQVKQNKKIINGKKQLTLVQGKVVKEDFDGKYKRYYLIHGNHRLAIFANVDTVPAHNLIKIGSQAKAMACKTDKGWEVEHFIFTNKIKRNTNEK
jgi:hypothetical protein